MSWELQLSRRVPRLAIPPQTSKTDSEIILALRAKGVALATCSNWLNNFIIGLITPPLVLNTGFGAYTFFAVFCLLSLIWTFCFVPETRGSEWHIISSFLGIHLTLPLGTLEAMDQYVFFESIYPLLSQVLSLEVVHSPDASDNSTYQLR